MTCLWNAAFAVAAALIFALAPWIKADGQTAESLPQVKKVFVDTFGTEQGASDLRDATIKALRKNSDIQIVASAKEADAILTGNGKIWVSGSMRVGPHGGLSEPVYDGYLQIELKGKGDKTLFSQRATPSKFPWNGIVWDLASHLVKNMLEEMRRTKNAGFSFLLQIPA
jgi:hypothetical protein